MKVSLLEIKLWKLGEIVCDGLVRRYLICQNSRIVFFVCDKVEISRS